MPRMIQNTDTGEEYDFDALLEKARKSDDFSDFTEVEVEALYVGMRRYSERYIIKQDSQWKIDYYSIDGIPPRGSDMSVTVDGKKMPITGISIDVESGDKYGHIVLRIPMTNCKIQQYVFSDEQELRNALSQRQIIEMYEEYGIDFQEMTVNGQNDGTSAEDNNDSVHTSTE